MLNAGQRIDCLITEISAEGARLDFDSSSSRWFGTYALL
jgi:hypothetical protein